MKKTILILLALILSCAACAESARDYALYLEEALPGAIFRDGEIPGYVMEALGQDYDFIARSDEQYGAYIAGVRREDAPDLPGEIHLRQSGAFSPAGVTNLWIMADADENAIYEFIMGEGVHIHVFEGGNHLIITEDHAYPDQILLSADAQGRSQLLYRNAHGFTHSKENRSQLVIPVHNIESWRAGATTQPTHFHMDVTAPDDLMGRNYLTEEELIRFNRIPIGIRVNMDGSVSCDLVLSETGVQGVEYHDSNGIHRLYEAGPGYASLLDLCEKLLGYRPGDMDFLEGEILRASFEWQGGSAAINDEAGLNRLEKLLRSADFTVGSVNCPSDAFLTIEFADGRIISPAVAINSFDLFFYNGLYFTAGDGELIELFNLKEEDLNIKLFGG